MPRAKVARQAVPTLEQRLDRIVSASGIPKSSLGISVVRVNGGETPVYGHRSKEPMIPASNTKLLTTAAILDRLGPDFPLATAFRADGNVEKGTLRGDLVVVGHGDPGISGRFDPNADPLAIFAGWARALRAKGIGRVEGDLVLDDRYFDREFVNSKWPPAGSEHWYQAPVSALSFEDNCIGIRVRPAAAGRPGTVSLVPSTKTFRIENHVTTVPAGQRNRARFSVSRPRGSVTIVVGGTVAMGTAPEIVFVTVDDPPLFFGGVLREVLSAEGIEVTGEVRMAAEPAPAADRGMEVERHITPLRLAVEVCNKRSQNFFAESFVKILGRERRQDGGWTAGLAEIEEALVPFGLNKGSYVLEDGSGISRGNRISAAQFTTLLAGFQRHRLASLYLGSLCAAGEEGCGFGRRLRRNGNARNNVFAKTGSIAGARTLSGYVRGKNGTLFAYSILVNSPLPNEASVNRLQDAILAALVDDVLISANAAGQVN